MESSKRLDLVIDHATDKEKTKNKKEVIEDKNSIKYKFTSSEKLNAIL